MHASGFPPVATRDARVLILGTLPGPESLRQQQYYAQPRNAFWSIMGELFGFAPDLAYGTRLRRLRSCQVALWDVCHSAYREGALDARIVAGSIVANDFERFFRSHPGIRLICFNGQTAAKLYGKRVLSELPERWRDIRRETLPSTSPAYAAMRYEEKRQQWRRALEAGLGRNLG